MTSKRSREDRPAGRGDPRTALTVRVRPNAARNELVAWKDGVLTVQVKAPPVEGKANQECARLVARLLGVEKSKVSIVAGHRARRKTIIVEMESASVERLLGERLRSGGSDVA